MLAVRHRKDRVDATVNLCSSEVKPNTVGKPACAVEKLELTILFLWQCKNNPRTGWIGPELMGETRD